MLLQSQLVKLHSFKMQCSSMSFVITKTSVPHHSVRVFRIKICMISILLAYVIITKEDAFLDSLSVFIESPSRELLPNPLVLDSESTLRIPTLLEFA